MKRLHFTFLSILFLLGVVSCTDDTYKATHEPPVDKGDETEVIFKLNVPGILTPGTYAISKQDENQIKTVDILVFLDNGVSDETFLYTTHATNINNAGGATLKNFTANLQKSNGADKHRIVVLTNLRDAVDAAKASLTTAMTKQAVLELIKFNSNIKWNTISSADFTPLPMWGETLSTHTITSTSTGTQIGLIKMLRAIARLDVGLMIDVNGDPQGLNTFKIEDVKVYNSNNSGLASPKLAHLVAGVVTQPSLPAGVSVNTPALAYNQSPAGDGLIREIYIAESDNKTKTNTADITCLVVGGYYSKPGDPVNTTVKTWYRVDFYDRTNLDPTAQLDILRNHSYQVNITKVDGAGYGTELEAFNSKPLNMETEITAWDQGEMNDVTFNGQYQLAVDKSELEFYMEGREQALNIFTDHPSGWEVKITDKPAWITLTPASDASGNAITIQVKASPILTTNAVRTDEFTITAGTLKKKIKVKQLNEPELTIDVTPTSLVFRKSGSNAKSIQVTTYPAGSFVYFTEIQGVNPISWLSTGFPISGLGNLGVYSFQPGVNGTASLQSATVTVYVQDANGNMASKTITIAQLATDLLFAATVANPYPAAGGNNLKFTVDSDTPWSILTVTDPKGALAGGFDNTLKPIGTGTIYNFSLNANNTWAPRDLSFIPTSSDPDFAGQPVVVRQNNANPSLSRDKGTIAFGNAASPAAQSIGVTSNAKWKITTAGSWANVVNAAASTAEQGSHTYNITNTNYVQFSPKIYTGVNGTPAAGTTYTATATFTTSDHTPATAVAVSATLSRAVPVFFTYSSLGATIGRVGGNVTVTAATNAAWKATPSLGTASANQTQTIYGNKSTTVNIPANTAWSSTTAAVNRPITVSTLYGLTTAAMSISGGSKILQQPGYYISGAATNLTSLAASSSTVATLSVSGAYPAISTEAWNGLARVVAGNTIAARESGTGSATVTIPANATWTPRHVVLRYLNPRTNGWVQVGSGILQGGYWCTPTLPAALPATIPYGARNVTVNFTGYFPAMTLRILNASNSTAPTALTAQVSGTQSRTFTIPMNNTSGTRSISLQYLKNGTWTTIASTVQDKGLIDLGKYWALPDPLPATNYGSIIDGSACRAKYPEQTGFYADYGQTEAIALGNYLGHACYYIHTVDHYNKSLKVRIGGTTFTRAFTTFTSTDGVYYCLRAK